MYIINNCKKSKKYLVVNLLHQAFKQNPLALKRIFFFLIKQKLDFLVQQSAILLLRNGQLFCQVEDLPLQL